MLVRLALAGILAVPSLLLSIVVLPIQLLLSLPSLWLLLWHTPKQDASNKSSKKRHVIITGGSSGIGKAAALEAAKAGTKVTILARDPKRLADTKEWIETTIRSSDKTATVDVTTVSVDVTDYSALDKVAEQVLGKPDPTIASTHILVCAGIAEPNRFHELEPEAFARQVQLNLLGSTYTARAFLPRLLNTDASSASTPSSSTTTTKPCTITFSSSQAGQVGVYGYSAYSPTKFALRGLAEVLTMEYYAQPIHIQVAYPPDTNTPGYANENKTKPYETILVSGGPEKTTNAADPALIGRQMYQAATCADPKAHVYFDFDGFILATLCSGFGPVTTLLDGVAQVCLWPVFRWVALFYLADWKRMLQNYHQSQHGAASDVVVKQEADKQD